jgi:hypothetical protein
MENYFSNFGNPWEVGTGFLGGTGMGGTQPLATMPQLDLPTMFANGLAAQGIRPSQFFANPEIARDIVSPPPMQNPWDATPDTGPPSMPWSRDVAQHTQTDDAQASAENDLKTAKEGTIADKFASALRGVKMPEAPPRPETPKIERSPSAPAPPGARGVGQSELLQFILAALKGQQAAPRQLPTLGASLRGIA